MKRLLLILGLLAVATPALAQNSTTVTTYREDTATADGEQVIMVGFRRCNTTPSSSSGTNGDRSSACVDGNGRIFVNATIYNSDGSAATLSADATHDSASATTGPQIMGECDDTSTDAVDEGDAGKARINCTTRALMVELPSATVTHLSNLATYLQPATQVLIRSDNTNNDDETQIKATAGVLLYISGRNSSADTNAFVRCTNLTAANTTPGSSTVYFEMMLPFGGGFTHGNLGPAGATFDTALTCYVATGEAATDATDAAQDDIVVNVGYR